MSQPIDRGRAEGFFPGGEPPPQRSSWDVYPPMEGLDAWRYARRVELATLATHFVIALAARDTDAALASTETWREDLVPADGGVVKRAVRLARMLQDAVDRARPR